MMAPCSSWRSRFSSSIIFFFSINHLPSLLHLFKIALGRPADRTNPIIGQFLERCSRGYFRIGVAEGGVVNIAADGTFILRHFDTSSFFFGDIAGSGFGSSPALYLIIVIIS